MTQTFESNFIAPIGDLNKKACLACKVGPCNCVNSVYFYSILKLLIRICDLCWQNEANFHKLVIFIFSIKNIQNYIFSFIHIPFKPKTKMQEECFASGGQTQLFKTKKIDLSENKATNKDNITCLITMWSIGISRSWA